MTKPSRHRSVTPIGQMALMELLDLQVPEPFVRSFATSGTTRHVTERPDFLQTHYPARSHAAHTLREHLRFSLRYEAFDLRVLIAAFHAMSPAEIVTWVQEEPLSAYSRRAWFLYELFTGQHLDDLPDVDSGNYTNALDGRHHVVSAPQNSPRHRVRDNLLGNADLCLCIRQTPRLKAFQDERFDQRARQIVASYDTHTLARAVSFLYTKETRSSYDIEGETPPRDRFEQFVRVLRDAATFRATPDALIRLQNQIVDPRYAARQVRDFQNYVGEATRAGEYVHYICPKPEDTPRLMHGWHRLVERLLPEGRLLQDDLIDPVVAAACIAFAFVLIHPFDDGNGRIHRFLIHHVLARKEFGPTGIVFPVSASILRSKDKYDETLESFSRPLQEFVEYTMNDEDEMTVHAETFGLYRAFDATLFAEFLYAMVQDTVERDLKGELNWITDYDEVYATITSVVDMPDKQARTLTRYFVQEGGRLSRNKRGQFPEISDQEIAEMTARIKSLRQVDASEEA